MENQETNKKKKNAIYICIGVIIVIFSLGLIILISNSNKSVLTSESRDIISTNSTNTTNTTNNTTTSDKETFNETDIKNIADSIYEGYVGYSIYDTLSNGNKVYLFQYSLTSGTVYYLAEINEKDKSCVKMSNAIAVDPYDEYRGYKIGAIYSQIWD